MIFFAGIFLCSAMASYGLGFVAYHLLRACHIVDLPNERASHTIPTVRGGGLAIIAVVLGGALLITRGKSATTNLLVMTTAPLAVLSFIDDLKSLKPVLRFACHSLAALAILWALQWPQPTLCLTPETAFTLPLIIGGLVCFLWLTGYTNAFNFMDGINGLAAGQALVTGLGSAVLFGWQTGEWVSEPVALAGLIAGAAAGFLPHNFPRARMFMGDVSSAPLGFMMAVLVLWIAIERDWSWLVPLGLLHANFVLDTGITLLRRISRGERWYESHREHFYQRLIQSGRSHSFVTISQLGLQIISLAMAALYFQGGLGLRLGVVVLTLMMWAMFFLFCERQWRCAHHSQPFRSKIRPGGSLSEREA